MLALATGLASFGLSGVGVRMLAARAILDQPNARSSHLRPTPRGGGVAVMAALLPAFVIAAWAQGELGRLTPLLAGVVLIAGVSFADDVRTLGPGFRLAAQGAAVLLGLLALPEGPVAQGLLPPGSIAPSRFSAGSGSSTSSTSWTGSTASRRSKRSRSGPGSP
jgi:UDP-N-acetylmuramyl pentapeptide phosphotransferase/UDP-N-acetylglucosamine-1-phosphate transferase